VKVVISGRAARQIQAIEQWWQANRMDARNVFTQELANGFRQLAEHPQSGARVRGPRANVARLRQLTLPVTRYLASTACIDAKFRSRPSGTRHAVAGPPDPPPSK
jgi:plasmid stabilization system protein ParE